MDPSQYRNDPTLDDAAAQLAQMEAEAAAEANPAAQPAEGVPASATPGARAPDTGTAKATPKTDPKTTDTRATEVAEADKTKTEQDAKAAADKAAAEAGAKPAAGSKFAQNQSRLEGGWKTLNERKAEHEQAVTAFKAREADLAKRERAVEQARIAAAQPKYKPEDYEGLAAKLETQVSGLEARAKQLEAEGKWDEAEKLKEQLITNRADARKAREYAAHLRANPAPAPQTDAQAEAEFRVQQKEWWGKAGIDFPAVLKAGSPESEALKALIKSEPAVVNDPKGMYYGARLVCAETSAARVPVMEKELGELRAKVKELSEKLAVPVDGAAAAPLGETPFDQKSEAEQESELYRMAEQLDARNR